jgi:hypothetical protein
MLEPEEVYVNGRVPWGHKLTIPPTCRVPNRPIALGQRRLVQVRIQL